jgi:hypothetical protein
MDEKTMKSVKKVAKDLAKDFAKNVKDGQASFDVPLCFCHVVDSKGTHFRYTTSDNKEIKFAFCTGGAYANLVNGIKDEFTKMVEKKLKGYVMRPMYDSVSDDGPWYSRREHQAFTRCFFYKPCKEFKKLTKRLSDLGKPVPDLGWNWRIDYVGGKRSWYNVEESIPRCTSSKKVNEVLDFLKGLKKVDVEIKRYENLDDRERGIRYETEWSGSIEYCLNIRAAKGAISV